MGVKERKAREKEELRQLIIRAATELFREESYASVSMRKIAKRIEYSVGTLYLYYKDKDELFLAVQSVAFQRAFAYIQQIPEDVDSLTRLKMMGERYVRFGLENPDIYRLMFMMEGPMNAIQEEEAWRSGMSLHNLLTSLVQDCFDAGQIKHGDADSISFLLWSTVHGMVSLRITERFAMYDSEPAHCHFHNLDIDELMHRTASTIVDLVATGSRE